MNDITAGANLVRRVLAGASLKGRDLSNVDASGADLTDAELLDVILQGARFVGATLTNTNLKGAQGENVCFTAATMSRCIAAQVVFLKANLIAFLATDQSSKERFSAKPLLGSLILREPILVRATFEGLTSKGRI